MSAVTQTALDADAASVLAAITDMYDAFQSGDRPRFDSHLDSDITTWESHLPRLVTRPELDSYRDNRAPEERPQLHELRVDPQRIETWDDNALARYELVAVAEEGIEPEVTRVTDVLRHTDAGWVIIHHHAELVRTLGSEA
jgi:ketosteroid isomerase-like protein